MNSIKMKRIESELVKTIADTLLNESSDELMKSITITGSEVAPDLSFAKVYFTCFLEQDHSVLEREMNEASDFIRKFVAAKMDLRQTPKLRFQYDDSIDYGNKIEKIIQNIHEDN